MNGEICWYCHWGWAKSVMDVYECALEKLHGDDSPLQYGPSHIVWSDENFSDSDVNFCLNEIATRRHIFTDRTDEEIAIIKESLDQLLLIPESERCCCPSDYDGEHPENYPPTVAVSKK